MGCSANRKTKKDIDKELELKRMMDDIRRQSCPNRYALGGVPIFSQNSNSYYKIFPLSKAKIDHDYNGEYFDMIDEIGGFKY